MFYLNKFTFLLFIINYCTGLRIFQSPQNKYLKCKISRLNKINSKKINTYLKNENVDEKTNIWKEYDNDLNPPIVFELYNWTKDPDKKDKNTK